MRSIAAVGIAFYLCLPQSAFAQSEEKTFKSSVPLENRADACESAKEGAQRWLRENTERTHPQFMYNQVRRGWPAKSDGTKDCDCSRSDGRFVCTVDAKISVNR